MSENIMFQDTLDAIRQGQRGRARDLLTRLLRADQSNPDYWLWMSAVVDSPKEQIFCLQSILRLKPDHAAARQGLVLLGALPAGEDIMPVPPVRRKWEAAVNEIPRQGGLLNNPILRVSVFLALAIVVVGMIVAGIFGLNRRPAIVAVFPTKTPGPPPTFTSTPTFVNATARPPTRTPTLVQMEGLLAQLKATYTPTPRYVSTEHPINETFNIGLRAIGRAEWERAIQYLEQAGKTEPEAADIPYYIGEAYRQMGEPQKAEEAFTRALALDANFAPAYVGRVRARLAQQPDANVLSDLDQAIRKDAYYGEAYIERAAYFSRQGDYEATLDDLEKADELIPGSALVSYLRAIVYQSEGDFTSAISAIEQAIETDVSLLPAYLLKGEVALQAGEPQKALAALETYLLYDRENSFAWSLQGQACYETGEYDSALEALNLALDLDADFSQAYLYRGLTYLELGEGQNAVNDLFKARKDDPRSYTISLGMGQALLIADRVTDALGQFNNSLNLAENDEQRGEALYWRAQVNERLENRSAALQDWKALLKLPETAIPVEWRHMAEERTAPTATPTPTITQTPTATRSNPTATPRPTKTPTQTAPTIYPTSVPPTATVEK